MKAASLKQIREGVQQLTSKEMLVIIDKFIKFKKENAQEYKDKKYRKTMD